MHAASTGRRSEKTSNWNVSKSEEISNWNAIPGVVV
jgi:hypothetical protein